MPNRNLFLIPLVFLLISCGTDPIGIYEGEIGDNKIILDFTLDNVVIVKSISIYYIESINSNGESPLFKKNKCSWTRNNKTISIYDEEKRLLFSLNFHGKDLIDRISGERLTVKKLYTKND